MRLTLVDNLVFPVGRRLHDFDIHPNLGLAALAAAAREAGHEVRIVDPKREVKQGRLRLGPDLYRDAAAHLLAYHPDVVGLTTLGCSFIFTARVADELKRRRPELPVLAGGPHATVLDREIMEAFTALDVIVRHEADDTIVQVLDSLGTRGMAEIPGITYRTGRTSLGIRSNPGAPKVDDLDRLPFPAYDLYPVGELDLPYLRVEAGRGCPWACTFCSTATFFQRSYRLKSPARLVADLDRLHARYGHTSFKLEHDLFTVNKRKVAAFCDAVSDRRYAWTASARIDCVDAELLEAMADAGCRELYFGIETGSQRLQASLKKRLDLDLLRPVLDAARALGIDAVTSFITGFPDELPGDRDNTLRLIGELVTRDDPPPSAQLHLLLPEPGTEQFECGASTLHLDDHVAEFNAVPLGDGDRAVIAAHPRIFATYHHYRGMIPRAEQIAVVEITRQFLDLPPAVLRHVLSACGLDLAELVSSVRTGGGSTEGGVARTVERLLGRAHPVTSLVRLSTGLASVRPFVAPAGDQLALSPDAHLFEDLHDCGAVLRHVVAHPGTAVPDELASFRSDYLAVRTPGGPRLFQIDPLTHAVASAFDSPASPSEIGERLATTFGRLVPVDDIVDRLVYAGALLAGSATSAPT